MSTDQGYAGVIGGGGYAGVVSAVGVILPPGGVGVGVGSVQPISPATINRNTRNSFAFILASANNVILG